MIDATLSAVALKCGDYRPEGKSAGDQTRNALLEVAGMNSPAASNRRKDPRWSRIDPNPQRMPSRQIIECHIQTRNMWFHRGGTIWGFTNRYPAILERRSEDVISGYLPANDIGRWRS